MVSRLRATSTQLAGKQIGKDSQAEFLGKAAKGTPAARKGSVKRNKNCLKRP